MAYNEINDAAPRGRHCEVTGMKRSLRIALAAVAAALLLCVGGFGLYVSDYYRADAAAQAVAQTVPAEGRYTTLSSAAGAAGTADVGLVFYPGAKVEAAAYLPLLQQLADAGVTCVLVEMPCNLAFLDPDAAADAMALHPEVERWFLAGHSLGGAMASSYAADHLDAVDGLILLGAYVYGQIPEDRVLVLYGENDQVLNRAKLTGAAGEWMIPGGNHAYFGNYGEQDGDGEAAIPREQQQSITVQMALAFMGLIAEA